MAKTKTVKRMVEVWDTLCPVCDEVCEPGSGEFCLLCLRSDIHEKHLVNVDKIENFAFSLLMTQHCEQCQDLADYISEALKANCQIFEASEDAS